MLIKTNNLWKKYGSRENTFDALRGVSIDVSEGEFVSIMGPSGSGKSTLLSILGGLNPPSDGNLHVDGIDVYGLSLERLADFRSEYLGFVFQQHQLIAYLTAIETVMLPLSITKTPNSEQINRAEKVLDRMGMLDKRDRLPDQLSGGEQERVAIARALVNEPPIILADEPTGNLDSERGQEVISLFNELNDSGQTIVMVTHDRQMAKNAHRMVEIRDGFTKG